MVPANILSLISDLYAELAGARQDLGESQEQLVRLETTRVELVTRLAELETALTQADLELRQLQTANVRLHHELDWRGVVDHDLNATVTIPEPPERNDDGQPDPTPPAEDPVGPVGLLDVAG